MCLDSLQPAPNGFGNGPLMPRVGQQEALAYGRTEELRQELIDRVRAMSFDELHALNVKMT